MARKWLFTCASFLPFAFASDDRSLIESRLQRLVSNPGYQEAFYRRVDEAFQNLSKPSADEAEASQRVQAVLVGCPGHNVTNPLSGIGIGPAKWLC
jgi:hypothetical protein